MPNKNWHPMHETVKKTSEGGQDGKGKEVEMKKTYGDNQKWLTDKSSAGEKHLDKLGKKGRFGSL
jgi:hypothetical protein